MLRLVVWERLGRAEAATVLGCSTAAFAMRLARARHRLRTALAHTAPTHTAPTHTALAQPAADELPNPPEPRIAEQPRPAKTTTALTPATGDRP